MAKRSTVWWMLLLGSVAACSTGGGTCKTASDCSDNESCTDDRCRLGRCSYLTIPGCCHLGRECTDPTRPHCQLESNRCVECLEDGDCLDPERSWCDRQGHRCIDDLGAPCTQDRQCGRAWCLREVDSGFPSGFCAKPCQYPEDCASLACLEPLPGSKTCLPACTSDGECRPDYICLPVGAGHAACFPHCTKASDCPVVGSCNPWRGLCGGQAMGNPNGDPCTSDADCRGFCLTEAQTGAPRGWCTSICSFGRTDCPEASEACVVVLSPALAGLTACLPLYDPQSGCREHYAPLVGQVLATEQPTAVCQPACRPGGCLAGTCNTYSGLCDDDKPDRAENGEPCRTHDDCRGLCMSFWPGGYCTSPCVLSSPLCPGNDRCMNLGVQTSCGRSCQIDQECRQAEGYLCYPPLEACVPGS